MNEQTRPWRRLSDILNNLNAEPSYLSILVNYEAAIANAIRSGTVPVRARRSDGSSTAFDRIERRIDTNAHVSVVGNTVYKHPGSTWEQFTDVEADFGAVQRWITENAIPASVGGPEKLSHDERRCRDWLRSLPESPRLTKDDALKKYNTFRRASDLKPIASRAFDRAWVAGAHSAWRKSGRPRGK